MRWYWALLLLSFSANAEIPTVHRRSGENFTLECSTAGCFDDKIEMLSGMYLYRDDEWVTYYDYNSASDDHFTPQKPQDFNRIGKTGTLQKHYITISNVTVSDSGLYRCVCYRFTNPKCYFDRNIYKVVISEFQFSLTTLSPKDRSSSCHESCHPPVFLIVLTATVSIVITMVFTLIIFPKAKEWLTNTREPRDARALSNQNVYEVMTSNGSSPVAGHSA